MDDAARLRAYSILLGMGPNMRRDIQTQYKLDKAKLTQLKKDWVDKVPAIDSASDNQVSVTTVRSLRRVWGQDHAE